jgi:uncharacterized protein (UPF0335 family)
VALLDYTTYDDIRAVLGVSSDEIEDTTLSLSVYEFGLASEIRGVSRTLVSDLAAVAAIPEEDWTDPQRELMEGMSLFATYSVAKQLLTSLPLFSPKEQTDGKASLVRYAMNPYEETIRRVEAEYKRFRTELDEIYAAFKSTSASARAVLTLMYVSSPSSDPVTGT